MTRVIKAVALLELIQEQEKTSAELIARCLYERVAAPNPQGEVQQALDALVGPSLLSLSEKTGYKQLAGRELSWQKTSNSFSPWADKGLYDRTAPGVVPVPAPLPWFSEGAGI